MKRKETFLEPLSEEEVRRERIKARALRRSQWWKRRCAEARCYYCRRNMDPRELTMDHIVPLVRGGRSTKGNVVPVCKECNTRKKYLLPIEWKEYLATIISQNGI